MAVRLGGEPMRSYTALMFVVIVVGIIYSMIAALKSLSKRPGHDKNPEDYEQPDMYFYRDDYVNQYEQTETRRVYDQKEAPRTYKPYEKPIVPEVSDVRDDCGEPCEDTYDESYEEWAQREDRYWEDTSDDWDEQDED